MMSSALSEDNVGPAIGLSFSIYVASTPENALLLRLSLCKYIFSGLSQSSHLVSARLNRIVKQLRRRLGIILLQAGSTILNRSLAPSNWV